MRGHRRANHCTLVPQAPLPLEDEGAAWLHQTSTWASPEHRHGKLVNMCVYEGLKMVSLLQRWGFMLLLGSPCSCWANAGAGGSCWQGLRCRCRPAPSAGAERRLTARPAAGGASCGCSSGAATNQTWPLSQDTPQVRLDGL